MKKEIAVVLVLIVMFIFSSSFDKIVDRVSVEENYKDVLRGVWGKITGAPVAAPPPSPTGREESGGGISGGGAGIIPGGGESSSGGNIESSPPPSKSSGRKEKKTLESEESVKVNFHYVCGESGYCEKKSGEGENECLGKYDDVCIRGIENDICRDTESSGSNPLGDNPFEKGATKFEDFSYLDSCVNENELEEWHCSDESRFKVEKKMYDCKSFGEEYYCYDGRCISSEEIKCEDSDGKDFFRRGILEFGSLKKEDECIGISAVVEYYCDKNGNPSVEIFSCPGESGIKRCVEGRCIYQSDIVYSPKLNLF